MDTIWLLELGALGALVGFVAALLGVSGGLMMTPALYWLLPRAGVDAALVPLVASASALATMVPTLTSAAVAQRRRRQVDTAWIRRLAPGLAAGAAGGALLASRVDALLLSLAFLAYALWFAVSLHGAPAPAPMPAAASVVAPTSLPASASASVSVSAATPRWRAWSVGGLIGAVSAVVGGGGVNLAVAYLMQRDVGVHRAVGTGPAVGLLLSVVASATFAGLSAPGLAIGPLSAAAAHLHLLGVVHWPTVLVAGACGMAAAPFGARLSARLPARRLRRAFALVTVGVALAMLGKLSLR